MKTVSLVKGLFVVAGPCQAAPAAVARPIVLLDSHIQRIVLATEETAVTHQVSHR